MIDLRLRIYKLSMVHTSVDGIDSPGTCILLIYLGHPPDQRP